MSTGNLQLLTIAKRLISATTAKGMAMAVTVGRFFKDLGLVENPSFTDTQVFAFTKVLTDAVNFTGEPVSVKARDIANAGAFSDSQAFSVGKTLTNVFATGDSGVILAQDYCGPDYFSDNYTGTQTTF